MTEPTVTTTDGETAVAPPSLQGAGDLPFRPEPGETADGTPISGEEGYMPVTIPGANYRQQDNPPTVIAIQPPKVQIVRQEQPGEWAPRQVPLTAGVAQLLSLPNVRRQRLTLMPGLDLVRIGPTQRSVESALSSTELPVNAVFHFDHPGEVWAWCVGAASLGVIEYYLSSMAPGYQLDQA